MDHQDRQQLSSPARRIPDQGHGVNVLYPYGRGVAVVRQPHDPGSEPLPASSTQVRGGEGRGGESPAVTLDRSYDDGATAIRATDRAGRQGGGDEDTVATPAGEGHAKAAPRDDGWEDDEDTVALPSSRSSSERAPADDGWDENTVALRNTRSGQRVQELADEVARWRAQHGAGSEDWDQASTGRADDEVRRWRAQQAGSDDDDWDDPTAAIPQERLRRHAQLNDDWDETTAAIPSDRVQSTLKGVDSGTEDWEDEPTVALSPEKRKALVEAALEDRLPSTEPPPASRASASGEGTASPRPTAERKVVAAVGATPSKGDTTDAKAAIPRVRPAAGRPPSVAPKARADVPKVRPAAGRPASVAPKARADVPKVRPAAGRPPSVAPKARADVPKVRPAAGRPPSAAPQGPTGVAQSAAAEKAAAGGTKPATAVEGGTTARTGVQRKTQAEAKVPRVDRAEATSKTPSASPQKPGASTAPKTRSDAPRDFRAAVARRVRSGSTLADRRRSDPPPGMVVTAAHSPQIQPAPRKGEAGGPHEWYVRLKLREDYLAKLWLWKLTASDVLVWRADTESWDPLLTVGQLRDALASESRAQQAKMVHGTVGRAPAPGAQKAGSIPPPPRVPSLTAGSWAGPMPAAYAGDSGLLPPTRQLAAEGGDLPTSRYSSAAPPPVVVRKAAGSSIPLPPPSAICVPRSKPPSAPPPAQEGPVAAPPTHLRVPTPRLASVRGLGTLERLGWGAAALIGIVITAVAAPALWAPEPPPVVVVSAASPAPPPPPPPAVPVEPTPPPRPAAAPISALPVAALMPASEAEEPEEEPKSPRSWRRAAAVRSSRGGAPIVAAATPQPANAASAPAAPVTPTPQGGDAPAGDPNAGAFDRRGARNALASAVQRSRNCSTGKFNGTVVLTFAPTGLVQSASLLHLEGEDVRAGCVLRAFQEVRVMPYMGEPVTVRKSFRVN